MDIRTRLCFELSRAMLRPPADRTADYGEYECWRSESLSRSWSSFSDRHVNGRDVLDFGCGDGQLSHFLAANKQPRSLMGVDLNADAIERARTRSGSTREAVGTHPEFFVGSVSALPFPREAFDTILAFDCLEHVMSPATILQEWNRVLRRGGSVLIEWFPFKGPWGPHMEALIPIPWAHVIFGQSAMFSAAALIYDLPEFVPRHWDLDPSGNKKPNKWHAWSSFKDQGYINELTLPAFRKLAGDAGFELSRFDQHSFGGSSLRRSIGSILMQLPVIGEYFTSYVIVELIRSN